MNLFVYFVVITFLSLTQSMTFADKKPSKERIRFVGSSVVYPYLITSLEFYNRSDTKKHKVITVEKTGSGGGISIFCQGNADVATSSRKITTGEIKKCQRSGVTKIQKVILGRDAIILATNKHNKLQNLDINHIYLAFMRPNHGKANKNMTKSFTNWTQISTSLADIPILFYGTPFTSGSFVTFHHKIFNKKGTKHYNDIWSQNYRQVGDQEHTLLQKMRFNHNAIGIFSYGFYLEKSNKMRALTINGIAPTFNNIKKSKYPLSRSLYLYINRDSPNYRQIMQFVTFVKSKLLFGDDYILKEKGLVS